MPIYRKYGENVIVKKGIRILQKCLFDKKKTSDIDLLHYAQMLPEIIPKIPFVIDFEHAASLTNFTAPSKKDIEKIVSTLKSPYCKKVIPLTKAANQSLKNLLSKDFERIKEKIKVVYPAMPLFHRNPTLNPNEYISNNNNFKILFVGNDIYRKGLHELLEAVKRLNDSSIELHIISKDMSDTLKEKYSNISNIHYYDPKFTKEEILNYFFSMVDLFVMPTHLDTFGMFFLDALSTGTPIITTKQFATPEIVKENFNGWFVDSDKLYLETYKILDRNLENSFNMQGYEEKLINSLVKKLNLAKQELLKSKDKYRVNTQSIIKFGGRYSVKTRNQKLSSIYAQAVI